LGKLMVSIENYPDLKANTNFLSLQQSLAEIENHLQMARRYYNGTVRDLNIMVESFPNNIVASKLGFKTEKFFEITNPSEREATQIKF
jgi:LemA protein